jgi:hypothetical protein
VQLVLKECIPISLALLIGVIGDEQTVDHIQFEGMEGVDKVMRVLRPIKLASREMHPKDTIVAQNGIKVGGQEIVIIRWPMFRRKLVPAARDGPCCQGDRHLSIAQRRLQAALMCIVTCQPQTNIGRLLLSLRYFCIFAYPTAHISKQIIK